MSKAASQTWEAIDGSGTLGTRRSSQDDLPARAASKTAPGFFQEKRRASKVAFQEPRRASKLGLLEPLVKRKTGSLQRVSTAPGNLNVGELVLPPATKQSSLSPSSTERRTKSKPAPKPAIGDDGGPTSLYGQVGSVADFISAFLPENLAENQVSDKPCKLPELEAARRLQMFPQKMHEVNNMQRQYETITPKELKPIMKKLYGVDFISKSIVKEALRASAVRGEDNPKLKAGFATRVNLSKFGEWFVKNMMRKVDNPEDLDTEDALEYMKEQIAKKHRISMEMVNRIYGIFMELDADGSGFLEKEEFRQSPAHNLARYRRRSDSKENRSLLERNRRRRKWSSRLPGVRRLVREIPHGQRRKNEELKFGRTYQDVQRRAPRGRRDHLPFLRVERTCCASRISKFYIVVCCRGDFGVADGGPF